MRSPETDWERYVVRDWKRGEIRLQQAEAARPHSTG
jgi:hypothetical protein